ncbi:MAG: hypothetical protein DHS20C21_22910 [Gemmatimonadota bacterium]|nr:MAG: hypothetical protein DHS20C21_22910 [Gemmatimonadota bacterium]
MNARTERVLVAALLLLFTALALLSARQKNPTFDEPAHLAAGISYVQTGDFRMNPEHPALPKLLAGVGASLAGAKAPAAGEAWDAGEQWDYAREVLYESGADSARIVFAGRVPMVLIGTLLGALLWWWMRAMVGPLGAVAALWLYAFSPTFLAHTRLVTTDVPLSLCVVATTAFLWQAWRTGRTRWVVAAAAAIGVSMVTKFSAFSYGPVWLLLALVPGEQRPWRRAVGHAALLLGAAFVFSELLVFACYGFEFDLTTIRSLGMAGRGVGPEQMSWLRRIPYEVMASVPWPSVEFARGMKDVILYTEAGHPVFLLGMRAEQGWWWQSFLTLAVKVPLPLLALGVWSLVLLIRHAPMRRRELVFLAAPAALVLFSNVAANLGLGVRHLLPLFPFLIGFAVWPLREAGPRGLGARAAVAVLLLWHAVGTLVAHPHYLSYFNEAARLAGGGHRLLGDSNLDWGQDLSTAARKLRERGANGAVLSYFGTASPFVEGMQWQLLPPAPRAKQRDPWVVLPSEGKQWLAVSTTNLQGVYYRAPGGGDPYPWLAGVEPDEVIGNGSMFLYEISLNEEIQRGLYEFYARHHLAEEAERALERVIRRLPHDSRSRADLVQLQLRRGDREAAERTMGESPNPDVDMLQMHVRVRRELGLEVESTYERALLTFPNSAELKNSYAWYLQESGGDLDLALRLADDAVRWESNDVYFRDTRGMVHAKRGDFWAALEDLDAALASPGGDLAEVRWHRVQILQQLGRTDDAVAEAQRLSEREDLPETLRDEVAEFLFGIEP